jgi:predicted MFS family arabinose efflux permease
MSSSLVSSLPGSTSSTATLPPAFIRLAWSNLAAQSAEQIGLAAVPIVAVLALGAGEAATGLLQTAQTLPFLLMSIPAGVLADRMSRARMMAGAEALRAAALLAILALAALGGLSLPLLALLGFVGACGTVAFSVAAPALVPALVPPAALPVANGRIELARTTAMAAGPALGGALVGFIGGGPAFGIAAALSIGAVMLLAGVVEPPRIQTRDQASGSHPLRDLRAGIAFVLSHPLLRPIFVTQFIFNTALFVIQAVYVPYAIHALVLSATGVGVTLAAFGAGMVAGALLAARIMRVLALGTVIAIGPVAGFVAALVMVLTIWLPYPALAALSFFLMGAGPILWVVSTTTLRQTVTPRDLLGRVSAINGLAYGARPLGAAIGAIVGGLLGAPACLILAAAGFALQLAVILRSPVPALERQPEMAG